jgi:trehalose 6-phosphate phosphatase
MREAGFRKCGAFFALSLRRQQEMEPSCFRSVYDFCPDINPLTANILSNCAGVKRDFKNLGLDMTNAQTDETREPLSEEQPLPRTTIANLIASIISEPERYALFFDIDGTLIDLAETPDAIKVPNGLADDLAALSRHLNGALALVTGRALSFADTLFSPHQFPIAGLHGTERRLLDGTVLRSEPTPEFLDVKERLTTIPDSFPGVLVEDKGAAIAVHFRQVPELANHLGEAMRMALSKAGEGYELQHGKMVLEIRPDSADKGRALEAYLCDAPFAGRIPIAFGDDLTDEAMFKLVNRMGGISFHVGSRTDETEARKRLSRPQAVRDMIATIVRT